jgi:putative FmdB family regulatory protein
MPTYDFKCLACGHKFDRFLRISDDSPIKCPKCGGPIERIISAGGGFILKGSGFYATDYRKADYKKKNKKESDSGSD